jgi:type IV secretory pathway VirB10-like protein
MSNPASDPASDEEEKPLDPEVARVQQRLQRLMLISGLTLGLGILAVFLAIIYRISATDDRVPVPAAPSAAVPPATIEAAPLATPASPTPTAAPAPPMATPAPATPTPAVTPSPPASPALSDEDKKAVLKEAKTKVPADSRLMSSTVAGDRIVLTYEHFAGTLVLLFDPETLEMVGRIDISATP